MILEPARREIERTLLLRFFPSFQLLENSARGMLQTNGRRLYHIHMDLQHFPIAPPKVQVVDPIMVDRHGRRLGERGASSAMHHLGRDPRGTLILCIHPPGGHDPRDTLYKSLLKSRLWLEAYESHLRSGTTINQLLSHGDRRHA